MVLGQLVGLIALACMIWVIYDVLANQKKMKTGKKVIWIVCGLLFSIITAIVYYLLIKK
ncbi:MAG: PLDc N-terminal domain-containing protein [Candidatus Woesearchaeota archaeon]